MSRTEGQFLALGTKDSVKFSSSFDTNHQAYELGSVRSWSAKESNSLQWIELRSFRVRKWIGIITQGREEYAQWVKKYRVAYSNDGVIYQYVDNGRDFIGNIDQQTKIEAKFDKPVYGKIIRIIPTEWHNHISLRFDAIFEENHPSTNQKKRNRQQILQLIKDLIIAEE